MKFNQLVDDAADKFEVAQAVNFADLAKQAQIKAQFLQLQSEFNIYLTKNLLLTENSLHFAVSIWEI